MTRIARLAAIAPLALAAVAATAAPAQASHGGSAAAGDRVTVRGHCSAGSVAKLKLKRDDPRRIEVELEVDQNRNGVPWTVTLRRPGSAAFVHRVYRTHAPSGSISVRKLVADRTGTDTIVAIAHRSGETCTVRASL